MSRRYLGVDWADREHAVWVEDEQGTKVLFRAVVHTGEGLAEFGRWLDEQRAQGLELWAALERPDGGVVDLLLEPCVPSVRSGSRSSSRCGHDTRRTMRTRTWR